MFLRIFTSLGMNIATVQSRDLTPALISQLVLVARGAGHRHGAWRRSCRRRRRLVLSRAGGDRCARGAWRPRASLAPSGCSTSRCWSANLRLGSAAACRLVGQGVGGVLAIALAVGRLGRVGAGRGSNTSSWLALAAVAWYLEPWRPTRCVGRRPSAARCASAAISPPRRSCCNLLANVDKILVGFLARARGARLLQPGVQRDDEAGRRADDAAEQHHAAGAIAQRARPHELQPDRAGISAAAGRGQLSGRRRPDDRGRETMLVLGGATWDRRRATA